MKAHKVTRPDGTDFRTGRVSYLPVGTVVSVENPDPPSTGPCGHGLHVSERIYQACKYADAGRRPWRFFEVDVAPADIIATDIDKLRCGRLTVTRELSLTDICGPGLAQRIDAMRAEAETWKSIRWLKPDHILTEEEICPLLTAWWEALAPFASTSRARAPLPRRALLVRDRQTAVRYAAADADADAAAAAAADAAADADADAAADAAAAADADAAADAADDAAAADAADADADADAAAAADADADADAAADAAAAAAAADAAAADADADAAAAAAAAADAAAALYRLWPYWCRWYVRPRWALYRTARWATWMPDRPNPWAPLVALFRLGAAPLGYVRTPDGPQFCVYLPAPVTL